MQIDTQHKGALELVLKTQYMLNYFRSIIVMNRQGALLNNGFEYTHSEPILHVLIFNMQHTSMQRDFKVRPVYMLAHTHSPHTSILLIRLAVYSYYGKWNANMTLARRIIFYVENCPGLAIYKLSGRGIPFSKCHNVSFTID